MEVIWTGKLPAYWSITNWALLTEKYAVVLFRELDTNRRKIRALSIDEKTVQEMNTKYNVLIGTLDSNVLLTRVEDARAHDQLSYFGWLSLGTMQMEWELLQSALVEKFSIPYTLDQTSMTYSCGLMRIDLAIGQASTLSKPLPESGVWPLGDMQMLQNPTRKGLVLEHEGRVVWELDDYLGSQYQGALGGHLFFLLPTDEMVCIDKGTGKRLWQVGLDSLTHDGRIKGKLDFYNETCARNSFIANIVINREMIVWATNNDAFYAFHIPTGKRGRMKKQPDQFLVNINDDYIMTLTIDQELGIGTLALHELEELLSEHY